MVLAKRLENGAWKDWVHLCAADEINAGADSANAKAQDRGWYETPTFLDYLEGARYIFNVARGLVESPREGDTQVYGVVVDQMVIGGYEELKRHFVAQTNRVRSV
jgi:hypothetical protein